MSALPATYTTNRCVAYVSAPAWDLALHHNGKPLILPMGWRQLDVQVDEVNARVVVLMESDEAEWTIREFAPLPVIGCFGLDGDSQAGVVSGQAANLHAALLYLFTRETEGEATC